ncbi:MAG: 2OG-Fe(II) oxygenase [Opitutales bacterium]|nr:2OG-Fe(II) oxygenase [Opitutales bacterium]
MSDTPDIKYAEELEALDEALDGLERPGDYFATGTLECAPPLMKVAGAGVISFPVPPEQARQLAAAAKTAPYGRGDQTLVDESVRKVRQVGPENVRLSGKKWTETLDAIVRSATEGLGRPEGSLSAEFYKLLIYEEGGFFLAHRDTEKAPGMLGTLIIVLPSAHEGGELIVRHDGREVTLDLRNVDPGELRYAAFYADCEHEVRPVREGHRVCLVYNLIMVSGKKGVAVPDARPHTEAAAKTLRAWTARKDRSKKIVYLLEHRYTEAALSFATLKGPDAVRARVLCAAAEASGCVAHLGMLHIEESGWAEYHGRWDGSRNRRRRWSRWEGEEDEDEEEQEDEDFEIGEVCDEERFISQWRTAEDVPVEYGEIPLEDGEVLPVGALDGEAPDKTHFSEATGNEGASFERTYLRAAVVLWPGNSADEVLASAGLEATLAHIGQRIEAALGGDPGGTAAASVRKLMRIVAPMWSPHAYALPKDQPERLISALVRFGDVKLLRERIIPLLQMHLPRDYAPLIDWARLAGPKGFQRVAEEVLSPKAKSTAVPSLLLWTGCAEAWRDAPSAKPVLKALLLPLLAKLSQTEYRDARDGADDPYAYRRPQKQIAVPCPPDVGVRFLRALDGWDKDTRTAVLEAIRAHTTTFSPLETLLPAFESAPKGEPFPEWAAGPLWRHAAEHLLERAAAPPPHPKDWTLPLTEAQRKGLPPELRNFALDPDTQVLRLPLRKELRQKIHDVIDRLDVDMTHVTERKGSPYTLVCTKTLGHYRRAVERYATDYDGLRRLAALPQAKAAAQADLAARLATALAAGKGWKPAPPGNLAP